MSEFLMDEPPHDGTLHDAARYYTRRLRRHPVLRAWRKSSQSVKRFVPSMWRLATHEFRQLPSVVIVGAQKAGTTQLFAYLIKHPRLLPALSKEIDYFSRHFDRSVRWYRSRFPLQRRVAAVKGHAVDASPSYLCSPAALHRMHSLLPGARMIAVLRDPVSRAFSSYQHAKTRHLESRTFEQAIEDELRQNAFCAKLGQALTPDVPPLRGYVARGYYALQLELLLRLYGREQVLIVDSADLFVDTAATCRQVFSALGLEPCDVHPGKIYNRGYYREKIEPATAARLRQHFRPYDELLAELLGRQLRWMASARPLAA